MRWRKREFAKLIATKMQEYGNYSYITPVIVEDFLKAYMEIVKEEVLLKGNQISTGYGIWEKSKGEYEYVRFRTTKLKKFSYFKKELNNIG